MGDSAKWDERFRAGSHADAAPDELLVRSQEYWPLEAPQSGEPRRALDVACGAGRHTLYLAKHGFQVKAIDFSAVGLELVAGAAKEQGLDIETELKDLEAPGADLGEDLYDLVAAFSFLHRPLFPALSRCLAPGGLLVYKTYLEAACGTTSGPRNPAFRLKGLELAKAFPELTLLLYEERDEPDWTAGLVAFKDPGRVNKTDGSGVRRVD